MNKPIEADVMYELTDEDYAAMDRADAATQIAVDRYQALALTYAEDVRGLHRVASHGTGVADLICQVLKAVHDKNGRIDLHQLHRLDHENGARVLRLVELFMMPSLLPDSGLTDILTENEIGMLYASDDVRYG